MKIEKRKLSGTFEIILEPHFDNRGFFMRTYERDIMVKFGIDRVWIHENQSRTISKHVIRGLHLQLPPYAETKLIRVVHGAIWDVIVDLRKDSKTYGQWDAIELTENNFKCIYIPKGFAHGFCTLTENSEILYKVDSPYHLPSERGILWSDPDLVIPWPTKSPTVSEKDSSNGLLKDFVSPFKGDLCE
ncbi:MAG: dTDP-4-dehydrorhamnose 3,5-epimerase [Candidatus Omnitrophota bacterium]